MMVNNKHDNIGVCPLCVRDYLKKTYMVIIDVWSNPIQTGPSCFFFRALQVCITVVGKNQQGGGGGF